MAAKAELAKGMQQPGSGMPWRARARMDGSPHRSDTAKNADMARADAETALDNYIETKLADATTQPAGPQHAQYAEFVGGTWRYPGRQMMERLQLERGDGDEGVGSALLGTVEASANIASAELPLDPAQEIVRQRRVRSLGTARRKRNNLSLSRSLSRSRSAARTMQLHPP